MDDIERAIHQAWRRIRPMLANDRAALRRRLQRRDSLTLRRPIRPWCLAVRANDTRIEDWGLADRGIRRKHEVTLTSDSLWELCRPVKLERESVERVAAKLGVRRMGLLSARLRGVFRTRHVRGLGAYWGHPVPLLSSDELLDPAAKNFELADGAWGSTRVLKRERIPDFIRQTLVRVPCFYNPNSRYLDPQDTLQWQKRNVERKYRSMRLPPPEPDNVWYKWKDGKYLGYDWRTPGARQRYEKNEARKARDRERQRQTRREAPKPYRGDGGMSFRGWRWLCPVCDAPVRMIFYPLPRLHLLGKSRGLKLQDGAAAPNPPQRFACKRCHRVHVPTRSDVHFWNELVTRLSGGMLYGCEVTKPQWLKVGEHPRGFRRAPASEAKPRRRLILRLVLNRWSLKRIATHLGVSRTVVYNDVAKLCARNGVRGGAEGLRRAMESDEPHRGLGVPPKPRQTSELSSPSTRS
jgi:hypothetical protein